MGSWDDFGGKGDDRHRPLGCERLPVCLEAFQFVKCVGCQVALPQCGQLMTGTFSMTEGSGRGRNSEPLYAVWRPFSADVALQRGASEA